MEAIVSTLNQGRRKRLCQWRNIRRENRAKKYLINNSLAMRFKKPCNHKDISKYECKNISMSDVLKQRHMFYRKEGKVEQDKYLTRFIAPYKSKDKRHVACNIPKRRAFECTYFVSSKGRRNRVCKRFFLATFVIGHRRLNTIVKSVNNGEMPIEKRGGDRKSRKFYTKREKVISFLKALPATESHYNRSKSVRCYLSSDLNISKLRTMYNNSVDETFQVKKTFFWRIFNTLNIGFSSPANDMCSTCFMLKINIKNETDKTKKQEYMTEHRIHNLRANVFYKLLSKDLPRTLTLCFDMQQVQPLPKSPIGDAFYLRQLSFYTMCVTEENTRNPTFYQWTEDQAGRGSVCISSALLNYLNCVSYGDNEVLRLFCDGCAGQNKNQHVLHSLMFWLFQEAPPSIKSIEIYFPVRGHSFLPADRIFARVEKDLRKVPTIVKQKQYYEIYSKHGTVKTLGEDWELYDIKLLSQYFKPIRGIQNVKRIYIKRSSNHRQCVLKTFDYFINESNEKYVSYLKKGKLFPKMLPVAALGNKIKQEKLKDISKLLENMYGADWKNIEDLSFFQRLLNEERCAPDMNTLAIEEEDDEEEICICCEKDCAHKV